MLKILSECKQRIPGSVDIITVSTYTQLIKDVMGNSELRSIIFGYIGYKDNLENLAIHVDIFEIDRHFDLRLAPTFSDSDSQDNLTPSPLLSEIGYRRGGTRITTLMGKLDRLEDLTQKEQRLIISVTTGIPHPSYSHRPWTDVSLYLLMNPPIKNELDGHIQNYIDRTFQKSKLVSILAQKDPLSLGDQNRIIKQLERAPILVLDKNTQGKTPLHIAVEKGLLGIVNALLKAGADIEAKDSDDNTPLLIGLEIAGPRLMAHYYRDTDHKAIVITLLTNGADIDVENRHGLTPFLSMFEHECLDNLKGDTASLDCWRSE